MWRGAREGPDRQDQAGAESEGLSVESIHDHSGKPVGRRRIEHLARIDSDRKGLRGISMGLRAMALLFCCAATPRAAQFAPYPLGAEPAALVAWVRASGVLERPEGRFLRTLRQSDVAGDADAIVADTWDLSSLGSNLLARWTLTIRDGRLIEAKEAAAGGAPRIAPPEEGDRVLRELLSGGWKAAGSGAGRHALAA